VPASSRYALPVQGDHGAGQPLNLPCLRARTAAAASRLAAGRGKGLRAAVRPISVNLAGAAVGLTGCSGRDRAAAAVAAMVVFRRPACSDIAIRGLPTGRPGRLSRGGPGG
jgi:hypothetical protein